MPTTQLSSHNLTSARASLRSERHEACRSLDSRGQPSRVENHIIGWIPSSERSSSDSNGPASCNDSENG